MLFHYNDAILSPRIKIVNAKYSTMKHLIITILGCMTFIHLLQAQQLVQEKKANPLAGTCCDTDSWQPAGTDANFMAVASTKDFGSMHLPPLPYALPNPQGNMVMFNCSDGTPGKAYAIMAHHKSNNYLIVIQEWWGLNDHIKKEAEKYYDALGGNVNVLAVDLYDGKVAETVDSAQQYIRAALGSSRKETILRGALDYTGANANVYSVGWCFGGMMSLQTAIMGGSKMKGSIMYYGTPEKDAEKINKIQCDVLGIFGTQDRSIPNETVDAFADNMQQAGKKFTLVRYDAVHAFANPSNPRYNKEFGDDAFEKSIAFLKARM